MEAKANYKVRGFEHVSESVWGGGSDFPHPPLPKRATKHSAGYDIFCKLGFTLEPGESVVVPSGFKVYMLPDEMFTIYSRSGLGFKYFARLANGTGIIDSDYYNNPKNEGHVLIKIRNEGREAMTVKDGDAIAQGVFQKFLLSDDDDIKTERTGGFGSTSK